MTIHNLDSIFEPKSVAVVGASDREGSIGHAILRNLLKGGFQGKLCPVNPRYEAVQGIQAYASVTAIGEPVDMAVIATPIATVDSILRECGEAGVKGAVIISAGGKETGSQGREQQGGSGHQRSANRLSQGAEAQSAPGHEPGLMRRLF